MKRKIIMSPQVAKYLIKNGCNIIDIKPDRDNSIKTCFVFELHTKLNKLLYDWSKNGQKGIFNNGEKT